MKCDADKVIGYQEKAWTVMLKMCKTFAASIMPKLCEGVYEFMVNATKQGLLCCGPKLCTMAKQMHVNLVCRVSCFRLLLSGCIV